MECEKAASCISVGEDCTQERAEGFSFECFEAVPEGDAGSTEVSGCINVECPNLDKSLAGGCTEELDEATCASFVNSLVVDRSESIPVTNETYSAGSEERKVFVRQLPVTLPEDELADKGEEMARLIGIWTKAKLDLKAYSKAAKKLIDETEERYIEIAGIVEAGSEERDVQCYAEFDTAHGVKRIYRCDTYELVAEETLTAAELQMDLNYVTEQSVANVEAFANEGETAQDSSAQEEGTEGQAEEEAQNEATSASSSDGNVDDLFGAKGCCQPYDLRFTEIDGYRYLYCEKCLVIHRKEDIATGKELTFKTGRKIELPSTNDMAASEDAL